MIILPIFADITYYLHNKIDNSRDNGSALPSVPV
jgi:hypothetical protein